MSEITKIDPYIGDDGHNDMTRETKIILNIKEF